MLRGLQGLGPPVLSLQIAGPLQRLLDGSHGLGSFLSNPQPDASREEHRQTTHHGRGRDHRPVSPRPFLRPPNQRRPLGLDRLILQIALQVVGQLLGAGVARPRTLLHRLQDNGLQLLGNCLVQAPGQARLLEGDLAQNLLTVTAGKGRFQRQQLIQGRAERIDVGAVVDGEALARACSGLM